MENSEFFDEMQSDYPIKAVAQFCNQIKEFFQDKQFYLSIMHEFLPQHIFCYLSEFFCDFQNEDDLFFWQRTTSGTFTVKSAYEVLRRRCPEESFMKNVWNSLVPTKVSIFLWKLRNHLLPFPEILSKVGIQILPSICCLCLAHDDGIEHTFFGCQKIRELWLHFESLLRLNTRGVSSLVSMLRLWWRAGNIKTARGAFRKVLPSLILLEIWKMRNKVIYEGARFNVQCVIHAIMDHTHSILMIHNLKVQDDNEREFFKATLGICLNRVDHAKVWKIAWIPPEANSFILSTDGSSRLNDAGYGFVIRKEGGVLLYGESGYLGDGDSFKAEVMGALFGLRKCDLLGLSNVTLQTDNKTLADILKSEKGCLWSYYSILHEMIFIIQKNNYKVLHIYREANSVADRLAKYGSNGSSGLYSSLESLPRGVKGLLILDQLSFPYIRTRCV